MQRVVVLGRGGAGKSTIAIRLGKITGLPVIELDKQFWQPGLKPTPAKEWQQVQEELTSHKTWIMDGDFGKYDILDIRLKAADTVLVLDFSLIRCLFRTARRSSERADFWWWLITWRWLSRPKILKAIKKNASRADVYILHNPKAVELFLTSDRCPSLTSDNCVWFA